MKWVILVLCFAPTLFEAYFDRFGETRKGKKKDTLWLLIAAACLIGLSWWLFDFHPLVTGLLILVFRFCTFDYLVHWLLKRYSENHPNINIWEYSGSTADFDKLTAKVPWRIRLIVRAVVLVTSGILFLS